MSPNAQLLVIKYRLATLDDAQALFELRRRSIIRLAPEGMPKPMAETWAANLTVAGMERKIRDTEIWIAERDDLLVGWGSIRGDNLEGLYTDPDSVGQGIATGLLAKLEGLMRDRGIATVYAEASVNAEAFYINRGYEVAGPQSPGEARPVIKRLVVTTG